MTGLADIVEEKEFDMSTVTGSATDMSSSILEVETPTANAMVISNLTSVLKKQGSTVLTIERRMKQLGKETAWNVHYNGKYMTQLRNARTVKLGGVKKGDIITLVLRNEEHHIEVKDATQPLLKLRVKACGDIIFTGSGIGDKQWIEPCNSNNEDLHEREAFEWTKGGSAIAIAGPTRRRSSSGKDSSSKRSSKSSKSSKPSNRDGGVLYA
ncbi:expressed unknown protein [Seminavis robusta]|uniref:Uncharacterized protein n=1 Tax=Seminavis robusta TaxID=568900 RepID=A0A9N8E4Q8_9STRA|nr:expressed unknown protein [Seminavis robusta]|eukprot:Sro618_g176210.1 n/a (211) ;mRNA; r:19311-19943